MTGCNNAFKEAFAEGNAFPVRDFPAFGQFAEWQRIVNTGRLTPYNRAYLQPTKAETNSMIGSDGQHAKINMIFADEEVDWIGITGIECQNVEHLDKDRWHTLDGRVLKQRPTEKGIYIHNGKKEVVK